MEKITFGTDGWRAIIADDFTFSNVKVVAQSIYNYMKAYHLLQNGLVIGYDNRFLGDKLAELIARVFVGNKCQVYLFDSPTPTPLVSFAVLKKKAGGGIMLTASHNPPEYNGIKFIPSYGGPATADITSQIEKEINKQRKKDGIKFGPKDSRLLKYINIDEDYINQLKKVVNFELIMKNKVSVVLDPMYGAGYCLMEKVFNEAGCRVSAIHDEKDPLFGGKLPDPNEENLKELAGLVKLKKADLGLALDGDGDRYGVVDSQGIYISANRILVILADYLIKTRQKKGIIVRTVATTHLLDVIAQHFAVKIFETPVGFKHIGQFMLKEDVIIGGEESRGLSIGGHLPEKDGLLATLLITELFAYRKKPISEIYKDLENEYGGVYNFTFNLALPEDKKNSLMNELKNNPPQKIGQFKVVKINTLDGVKFIFNPRTWMLLRPSGTEPLVRGYLEAPTQKELDELKKAVTKKFDI